MSSPYAAASHKAPVFFSSDCSGLTLSPARVNVVIYHSKCWDGFGAAWAVWSVRRDAAVYIPRNHTDAHKLADDILPQLVGKHVVVLDYCFPLETTRKIMAVAASFGVLDHHASSERDMGALPSANKVFTMEQSGATLAFNFMYGPHAEVPLFLRYIEDGDLWRKALGGTEAFRLALATLPFEFEAWNDLISQGELGVNAMLTRGAPLVAFRDDCVASAVSASAPCTITGFPHLKARVVNTRNWVSEVGAAIVERTDADVALMWTAEASNDGNMDIIVSLRCRKGGLVDVAAIAASFGGGGHTAAASFRCRPTTPLYADIFTLLPKTK